MKRLSFDATKSDWTRFAVWALLLLAFLWWIESWLGLVALPLLFDAYITRLIPWSWWRKSTNKSVRAVMGWVDAIVFALVAVYFVNIYFFQNYVIPSSSLEKSLLTGDYLLVSKVTYGPRGPMTPLHMPLTGHTLPILDCQSYLNWPSWDYKRAEGTAAIEAGDIVVFNYPAGDTVMLKEQSYEYMAACYDIGSQILPAAQADTLSAAQRYALYGIQYALGRQYILGNESELGAIKVRPVDMRENYVKRCVGLPGETLQIKRGIVYRDNKPMRQPENAQQSYILTTRYEVPEDFCDEYGISLEDLYGEVLSRDNGITRRIPLTQRAVKALQARPDFVVSVVQAPSTGGQALYPHNLLKDWTCSDYGPVWIPKRGATVELTIDNLPVYERCIRAYEGHDLRVEQGDRILIDGQPATSYTFAMDYYWMMGDNRDNSQDSRFWGFVPEDHIVGKPLFIWLSLNPDKGWLEGKIRFSRLFRSVSSCY